MHSEENKLQNIRVYRKRQQKDSKIQLSNRESEKYQTATVNKPSHTDDNHQPDVLSSSRRKLEKNHHNLSLIQVTTIKNLIRRSKSRQSKKRNFPIISNKNSVNEVSKNLSSNSSKLKRKTVFKNLAFEVFSILLIVTLIVMPIVAVYYLSSTAQNTEIDPCQSSRTLTFDDIGTNPYWIGSSGYGGMLPGYGGFTWLWANYVNVSNHIAFSTALVSVVVMLLILITRPRRINLQ